MVSAAAGPAGTINFFAAWTDQGAVGSRKPGSIVPRVTLFVHRVLDLKLLMLAIPEPKFELRGAGSIESGCFPQLLLRRRKDAQVPHSRVRPKSSDSLRKGCGKSRSKEDANS